MTAEPDSLGEPESRISWESPPFEIVLEHGRIADVIGAEDDTYRSTAAARVNGFADVPTPVTFLGSLFYLDQDVHEPDLGFDGENVLHRKHEFEFDRCPVAGETLYGKTTLVDIFRKDREGGGHLTGAVLETTFRDEDGEFVCLNRKRRVEVVDG